MDTRLLEDMGFTRGELRVYFALLELGTTTSGPIITKSKVARSKVYEILNRLKEKGLVSEIIRENIRYFQALSPKKILDYLQTQEIRIKEQRDEFKDILPALLEKQRSMQSEHQIKVYQGYDGIKTFYLEMMKDLGKNDEYLGFSFSSEVFKHKTILNLLDKFHVLRSQQGAKAKILCTKGDMVNAKKLKSPANKNYEFKVSKHPFPHSVSIFKDSVATFIWDETPRVFVIVSKENATHYRKFFMDLWESS